MRYIHSLLIVYFGPPLLLAVIVFFAASALKDAQTDQRPTGTIGVKKGGRIGGHSEMRP